MSINNIESSYFKKIIFSMIDDGRKLKIVQYNKSLQNLIEINFINYKLFSARYVVYELNGKVKEYSACEDNLLFEGEYFKGKRNGKGKEYSRSYKGRVLFEGEYLNGKRHGKGKEYYYSKKEMIFEGDYFFGRKWNGKGYNSKGKIIFELNGGKGTIKEYDEKEDVLFEGEYLNGYRYGKGIESGPYGIMFEGEYYNGKRWNGKMYYDGNVICELKNGNGLMKLYEKEFDDALIGEGEYINGELNGQLKSFNEIDGTYFEIEYKNGKKNGKGKEIENGEIIFEGEYLYDYKRKGKEFIKGRLIYEGEYLFDVKWNGKGYDEKGNIIYELNNGNGKVKEYDKNRILISECEILDGKKHGICKEYNYKGKLIFEGEYLNGKKNGKGKEYNHEGLLQFEGEYLNGKKCNGKGKKYDSSCNKEYEFEFINGKGKKIENNII